MSFRKSYTKSLKEIKALRKKINDSLDLLENSTLKELDKLLATMRTSIQADIKKCTESVQNMTCVQDDWLNVKDKNEVIHFIKYRKCLEQSLKTKTILQGMATTQAMTLTFNPDTTIKKNLATLSGLGQILCQMKQSKSSKSATENMAKRSQMPDSNTVCSQQQQQSDVNKPSELCNTSEVITKKNRERYTVKTKDRNECNISNICETSMGERLITDKSNCKVKLLDKTYKVVAHYDLPGIPLSMCSIDSNLVAVAVDNCEVHFIRVTDGQLIKDRIQKLEHPCLCIAHKGSHLYITSSTALYQYTVDGTLVRKMYEDALDSQTGNH
ncbi:hypothetical protein DPMN_004125 [Dreissena polymorpha]|uniref:Uncharacterized protein n=1 Tax=Dreissena polymorpha TaxID=45954 RepID=A0A9D4RVD2_DREPO|nr:hypothetical protein DPMN_004125 [Dreissena polymorpha]